VESVKTLSEGKNFDRLFQWLSRSVKETSSTSSSEQWAPVTLPPVPWAEDAIHVPEQQAAEDALTDEVARAKQQAADAAKVFRALPPRSNSTRVSPIDCSVYAPPQIARGSPEIVQVFLHQPEKTDEAKRLATEFDTETERRGFQTLDLDLPLNTRVDFHLTAPGIEIEEPFRSLLWRGRTASLQY
jgi:hypothetical protein